MLEQLTTRIQAWASRLAGRGTLSAKEIDEALAQVRVALLEADVHHAVVEQALDRIKARAAETKVAESISAGDRMATLVGEELARLLGERQHPLKLSPQPPTVIMLVGLQGSGKTTTAGKLARLLKRQGRRVLLVAADPRRPAAVEQLQTIGRQLLIDVAGEPSEQDAVALCRRAIERAQARATEIVIIDTAGRLQIDDALMAEATAIKQAVSPQEVWLVVDAMMGQEAVATAQAFSSAVGVTGVVMTKLDGDARGGALLSIRAVTGLPVTYIGTGEKSEALELFHPDRMASRILGRGDLQSLMERVAALDASKESGKSAAAALQRGGLTLEEFRKQLSHMNTLGSVAELLAMVPGAGKLAGALPEGAAEQQMTRASAIIDSMTLQERRRPELLNGRRRQRIAKGSGTSVQEINQLMRQFQDAQRMMKQVGGRGGRDGLRRLMGK
ncbi:MAG: signal recognition particle protein [Nitrospirota bacterium]